MSWADLFLYFIKILNLMNITRKINKIYFLFCLTSFIFRYAEISENAHGLLMLQIDLDIEFEQKLLLF